MNRLVDLLLEYGVTLAAANVFLEQIGAPIPAVPTLIVAGALAREGKLSSTHLVTAAVLASLLADYIWFLLGRRYGTRVLRTLCRISLNPDSCVSDTESRFERWGVKSLLIAKFIPGFSTIAPPLAGITRAGTLQFLLWDGAGALIWAGGAVALGRLFHHAIARVLEALERLGWWALVILGSSLLLFIGLKWWQRVRFIRSFVLARVEPHELFTEIRQPDPPVVIDVRAPAATRRDPRRIPTAIPFHHSIEDLLAGIDPATRIVLYCT